MPRINFDDVDDAVQIVPEGTYVCALSEIAPDYSQKVGDFWRLKWKVSEGEAKGRIIEDPLFFTEKSLGRVKLLCSKVGLPVTGTYDLQPKHLLGKRAKVTVEHVKEEYQGKTYTKAKVPFGGYEALDGMVPTAAAELEEEAIEAGVPTAAEDWPPPKSEVPF